MANNDNKLISLRGLEEFRKLSQWTLSKDGTKVVLTGPKGETSSADVSDVNIDKITANTTAIEDITDRVETLENNSVTAEDIAELSPAFTESSTLTNISSGDTISTLFGKIRKAIADFMAHITNYANPHRVTKEQVGLGNVDNTADVDKPVSTAMQEALNGKVSKLKPETLTYDLTAPNFIGHLKGGADQLANERTISLSGDATGSVKFDGTKDVDISTTVVDASGVTAGKMYLYQGLGQNTNGTITQKLFTDLNSAVDDVQKSADGKNTIYYKTTAPVASDDVVLKQNDLWFDTDDGNKPYRWNGTAWVEAPFGDSAIANLDAGKISAGYISAARIAANTIASEHIAAGAVNADKIDAGAVTADKIDTGAVTADKISVDDLSALNATIGGFSISNNGIYSADKSSFADTDSGVFFGSDGTINIGDSSQYIKFSDDGLQIKASSLSISGADVATTADLDEAVNAVAVEYVSSDSPVTPPTTGWSVNNPNWEENKYVWQRTITQYVNGTTTISDPVCIQGARGVGVVSQIPHYLASEKSEGVTPADSGWSKTAPTLTNEKKYLWVYYTNMLSSKVEPEVVTETGNPVEFESRGNNPITGSIHLPPIQDNDYGYAWAGGEGKNILPYPYVVGDQTIEGVEYTVNADGSVTAVGTPTANHYKRLQGNFAAGKSTLPDWLVPGESYVISDSLEHPTAGKHVEIDFYNASGNSCGMAYNDTFTVPDTAVYYGVFIRITKETGPVNETFYPMIRKATEEDSAWEPYENICPINSYTTASVKHFGKNILDANVALRNNSNGLTFQRDESDSNIIYVNGKATGTWSSIFAGPINVGFCSGKKYTFSVGINTPIAIYARVRNVDGTTNAKIINVGNNHITWTQEKDGDAITEIVFKGMTVGSTTNGLPVKLMISSGEDSDYEKPSGVTYDITLPTATYCSDVTLYDNGSVTLSSHGDTETFDGTNVETSSVSGVFKLPLSHVPETVGFRDEPYDLYCDKLKPVSRYDLHNGAHGIAYDGEGNYLQFRAGEATTLAEAKAWLTANPVTVVYRKAVPTTTSLPSMDISTFAGKNMFYTHDNVRAEMTVSFKDCDTITTEAYITGVYGDKGVDGVTPVIEASKNNGVTVITSNGVSIAQINDGVDGESGSSFVDQIAYYLASDKPTGVTVNDSGWSREIPELSNEKKYLWVYYTNRFNSSGTEPELITETGDVISTESLGENPVKLSIDIEPHQDLNGYDHAWAGGAGKNLLPNNTTTTIINGVTFIVNADKSVTANGTATADAQCQIPIEVDTIPYNTQLYFSGCPSGGSGSKYHIYMWDKTTNARAKKWDNSTGSGNDIGTTANNEVYYENGHRGAFVIRVMKGVTVNNITFHPMIRLATESDSTYEPYENICPITGYNGVEVVRTGKNLFSYDIGAHILTGVTYVINDDGTITFNGTSESEGSLNLTITSPQDGNYYFTGCPSGGSNSTYDVFIWDQTDGRRAYQWDGITSSVSDFDGTLKQVRFYSGHVYSYRIRMRQGVTVNDLTFKPMICMASETSAIYEPYTVTSYPITLPSEEGTVYGGSLTIDEDGSGTLTVDMVSQTFNGSESWSVMNAGYRTQVPVRGVAYSLRAKANWLVSASSDPTSWDHLIPGAFIVGAWCTMNVQNIQSITDVATLKAYLAENPLTIVYPIVQAKTYTLTNTQVIKLLKGDNNIWANVDGEITVSYSNCETTNTKAYVTGVYGDHGTSYVDQIAYYLASNKSTGVTLADEGWSRIVPELTNEKKYLWVYYTNRFNPSGAEPKLVTKTGEIVTTESLGENPVQLNVDLEPKQNLNGYDHPWVGGAGKNLINDTSLYETTYSGVSTTLKSDKGITLSGTNTNTGSAIAVPITINNTQNGVQLRAGKKYYFCGNWSDGHTPSNSLPRMDIRPVADIGTILAWETEKAGGSYTPSEDMLVRICVRVPVSYTIPSGLTMYPMLTADSNATYEPYENICPITGYNGVEVVRTGKNILDLDALLSGGEKQRCSVTEESDGSVTIACTTAGAVWIGCAVNVGSSIGRYYTVGVGYGSSIVADNNYMVYEVSADNTVLKISGTNNAGSTYTITNTSCTKIGFRFTFGSLTVGQTAKFYPMVRLVSSTDSTFELYSGTTYNITFPSSIGTVYGGNLTVNEDGTGTLVVTHKLVMLAGQDIFQRNTQTTGVYRFAFNPSEHGIKGANKFVVHSNVLKAVDAYGTYSDDARIDYVIGNDMNDYRINFYSSTLQTVEAWKAFATEYNVQVMYLLESPQAYTLTNTQVIKLLKGQNNIWTDVEDAIEVTYTDCETANTDAYVTGVYGDKGNTPVITSSKSNGVTVIKSDGLSVAEINDGERGTSIIKITTAPESYTTTTGGFTPTYRVAISAVHNAGVAEALVGDILENSYYHYPVGYVDDNYAYLGARVSIRGATGSRGATWYAGTAITGTSTTATVFSGSGISSAIVGDHYLNTDTQNVYVCKKAGAASVATWAFEQNIKGENGTPGTKGADGKTAYFHVKYSNDGGTTFTANSGETAGSYIGTYTDNTSADSASVSAYTWVKIEGTDGVSPTLTTSKTNGVTTITITDASGTKTATVNDGTAGARGATWYAGTAITGTSTTAAVFSGSGIASAIVGDHYLNTSTQNVYVCKKAGNASTATWAYEQNIKGATGTPGTNGTNGKTAYFHVKYSNDGGATFTANSGETAGSYIGTYTDNTAADSTSVSAYTWVKIEGEDGKDGSRGATWYAGTTITGTNTTAKIFSGSGIASAIVGDHYLNTSTQNVYVCKKAGNASTATWAYEQNIKGAQGTPGTNGTDGKTAYFHVKYSNDGGTTFTANSGETAGTYIGTYTDNTAADSTSVSAYTWVKIEGTDGKNGTNAIGLAWRVNSSDFTNTNNGECYFHGFNADNEDADVDGWVMWNGEKLTVTKGMWINTNGHADAYTPILHVYRTTTEPHHADVWWDKNLKKWRGYMYTTGKVPGTEVDWDWDEANDAVLATFVLNGTAAESVISSAQLFNPPKKFSELPNYEGIAMVEDIGVNLSPYFARSPYTYDNPYWHYIYSDNSSLYQIEEVGDGWMHVYCHNTTSSTVRHDYGPVASNEIEEGADYTFLVEVRNNHSTGTASGTDIYLVQTNNYQFWGGGIKENIEGDGATGSSFSPITHVPLDSSTPYIKRFVKTSEATGSTHWTLNKPSGLAVFTTRCAKNTTIDYEIRISVYKGRYTGPFRPYVDASVRNVADNANSKIDNLQVGGRNLLLGSNDTSKWGKYKTTDYNVANINTSIALVAGQEYTLTIWGEKPTRSDKSETYYQAYYSGGSIILGRISIDADKGYGSLTFTMPTYSTTSHYLSIYNTPPVGASGTTYGASIEKVKLEMGNHATDWTAAPEDFESGIATAQTTANNAQTAAGNAQTTANSAQTAAGKAQTAANNAQSTANTAKDLAESVQPELIVGTHGTSATATWTGKSTVLKEIKAGTRIQYKLSSAGKADVTLNLTLATGSTTGAKEVYYNNTTRLGTQYGINAVIDLVYDGSHWRILNPYTNSNNYDRILYSQAVKAATAYIGTHILCGTSAGYSDIGANVEFELSYPLLWYATAATTTISAGKTANNHYLTYPNINFSVNGTIQSGGAYKQLYLKGTMTGGKFKIAASNYLTTVEPTSADGLYYIPLGVMSSATNGRFVSTDKLYAYLNGAFQCVEYASKELADEAAKTATNFMYFDNTNGLVISQEGEINASHPVTALQNGNVRIDSDSVDIYNGQEKVASYGGNVVIGKKNETRIELDYHSLKLLDYLSNPYLNVSDLRNRTGVATFTENFEPVFIGDGYYKPFELKNIPSEITSVTIRSLSDATSSIETNNYTLNISSYTVLINHGLYEVTPPWILLSDQLTEDNYVVVSYTVKADCTAFTFGKRSSSGNVGAGSVSFGESNIASAMNSMVFGRFASSNGMNSISIGTSARSDCINSVAIGYGAYAAYADQVAIGRYNNTDTKHDIFLVGNGTSETNRNTAFRITKNGAAILDSNVFSYYRNDEAGAWGEESDPWFINSTADSNGSPSFVQYSNSSYFPSGWKMGLIQYDEKKYNPNNGIVVSETLNTNYNSPSLYTRSIELIRGAIYELYTYEYNVEKTAAPYNYRGSHAYLITVPAATNYTKSGAIPSITTIASSQNSGVSVVAKDSSWVITQGQKNGSVLLISPSSTAYRVKYVLRRCSHWKSDQDYDAVERAFWKAAHSS